MSKPTEKVMPIRKAGSISQIRDWAAGYAGDAPDRDESQRWRSELGEMPLLTPPPNAWRRLQRSLDRRDLRRRRRYWARGLAASMLVVLVLGAVSLNVADRGSADSDGDRVVTLPIAVEPTDKSAEFDLLVAESRRLENLLRVFPARQELVRAETASTIVGLEDQIALVDAQLSAGAAAGAEADYRRALWRERVDLMNALVYVRAAQAQRY